MLCKKGDILNTQLRIYFLCVCFEVQTSWSLQYRPDATNFEFCRGQKDSILVGPDNGQILYKSSITPDN